MTVYVPVKMQFGLKCHQLFVIKYSTDNTRHVFVVVVDIVYIFLPMSHFQYQYSEFMFIYKAKNKL